MKTQKKAATNKTEKAKGGQKEMDKKEMKNVRGGTGRIIQDSGMNLNPEEPVDPRKMRSDPDYHINYIR